MFRFLRMCGCMRLYIHKCVHGLRKRKPTIYAREKCNHIFVFSNFKQIFLHGNWRVVTVSHPLSPLEKCWIFFFRFQHQIFYCDIRNVISSALEFKELSFLFFLLNLSLIQKLKISEFHEIDIMFPCLILHTGRKF